MLGFLFKNRRRRQLLAEELPDSSRRFIEANVAVFALLSPGERQRLLDAVKIIVAERRFVGSGSFCITEEVQVTIAAQAALLLLGEEGYYFDRVPTIYVYRRHPTVSVGHPLSDGGAVQLVEEEVVVQGQALGQGEIRLSWNEVLYGGREAADGENVVLHEFAHHLDSLDGEVGGTPPLPTAADHRRWTEVFDRELATLRDELRCGRRPFLHAEAAENAAELFAYSTECFFEQPAELAEFHPDLFDCLLKFYKTDPQPWFGG